MFIQIKKLFIGETKMYKKFSLFSLFIISISMSLSAYEPYGSHASDKWQIWAYSTAAPSFLGDKATIIGSNYSEAPLGGLQSSLQSPHSW